MIKIYSKDHLIYGYCHGYNNFNNANIIYSEIPTDGLIFYAPLDSKNNTAKTGQSIIEYGNPDYIEYNGRKCIYLDGNSYLTSIADLLGSTNRTMCCWINYSGNSDSSWRCAMMQGTGGGSYNANMICKSDSNTIAWSQSGGSIITSISPLNKWNHVAIIYENQYIKIYINGILTNTGSQTFSINKNYITIGAEISNSLTPSIQWIGYISDCILYNRALTEEEIKILSK